MRKKRTHQPYFFLKYYKNEATRKVAESLWYTWLSCPGILNDSPEDVTQYLLDQDLKPATIKKCLYIYKKWRHHYEDQYHEFADIKPMIRHLSRVEDPPTPKAWTKEEAAKALDHAQLDTNLYNMLVVTLHTGMRKGELFGLEWKDIDFINGRINIRHTKSGKPRSIPMSAAVEEVLQSCYIVGVKQDEPCFKKCEPNHRLKKLCEMADIRVISWHGARHTFATLALNEGRSPRLVSAMLGHTKVSTTLDLYWGLTGEDLDLSFLP